MIHVFIDDIYTSNLSRVKWDDRHITDKLKLKGAVIKIKVL